MNLGKHLLLGATALALGYLSAPANASLILTGVACDGHSTSMTSDPGYVACSGAWSGNNKKQTADVSSQISSDWGLSGLQFTEIAGDTIPGSPTGNSGTLTLPTAQTGLFVIALKAGDAFSLYEFDGSKVAGGISSLAFDTLGVGFYSNGHGNNQEHFGQGLSHADLYATAGTTSVPEPGALTLLAAGLMGLGFLLRRRGRATDDV